MKAAVNTLLALALIFVVGFAATAEDKKASKDTTLKGTLGCAKCVFKVKGITKCTNAIEVKGKGGEKEIVLIDDAGGKASYHKEICTESKAGSVTGVVSTKGKQKHIKPAKDGVKFD